LHRVLDRGRRIDRPQLDAGHAQAPAAGLGVEHPAQLLVDHVAAGQRLLERETADHVTERRGGELLHGDDVVVDLVHGRLGVGDLEVDHRVDAQREVVLGDHRLRREGDHPLAQVHLRADAVDERDDQGELPARAALVAAEPLDDGSLGLGDELDRARHDGGEENQATHTGSLGVCHAVGRGQTPRTTIAVAPWISCTRIFSPASNVSPSSSGRAVHVSPPSSTRPPPEPTASTTVPSRPVRAAVLVSFSGSADNRRLRARGRTPTSRITETSANARAWPHNGAPRNAAADPPSAPPASIRRTSSPPNASPAASSTAAPSHPSPICMPRHYRLRGTGCDVSYGLPACGRRRLSSSDVSTLLKFAWLSVATAVVSIGLKTWAWWMTGSVGLLSDASES